MKTIDVMGKCPNCKNSNFIEDINRGEVVCSRCGFVLEENMPSIDILPQSSSVPKRSRYYKKLPKEKRSQIERRKYARDKFFNSAISQIEVDKYTASELTRDFKSIVDKLSEEKRFVGGRLTREQATVLIIRSLLRRYITREIYMKKSFIKAFQGARVEQLKNYLKTLENIHSGYLRGYSVKTLDEIFKRGRQPQIFFLKASFDKSFSNLDMENLHTLFHFPNSESIEERKNIVRDVFFRSTLTFSDAWKRMRGSGISKRTGLFCAVFYKNVKNASGNGIQPKKPREWHNYFRIKKSTFYDRLRELGYFKTVRKSA